MWTLAAAGCAGGDPQASESFDENVGPEETALLEDHFTLENGARIAISLFDGKSAVLSVSGPTGTEVATRDLVNGATLGALYKALRPGATVPALVRTFDERLTPAAIDEALTDIPLALPSVAGPSLLGDKLATVVTPQATWFARTFCKNNVDITKTFGTWYQAFDICHETRTSEQGVTWWVSNLRQMFTALSMRKGTATFVMSRRANSTTPWTVVQNHTVPEGTFRFARLWQVNTTATNDMKFEIKNTTGDLFDWAVQTARTPMGSMPAGQFLGGVKYDSHHFLCNCTLRDGRNYQIGLEYCLTNPLVESPGDDSQARRETAAPCSAACVRAATGVTGSPTNALASGFTTIGRRSNGQPACTPGPRGDARVCDRGTLPAKDLNGIDFLIKSSCTANGFFPSGWEPSTLQ